MTVKEFYDALGKAKGKDKKEMGASKKFMENPEYYLKKNRQKPR